MKQAHLLIALCCFFLFVDAQNYRITWGEEIKLKKGTLDLDIVSADNTGLFFTESRLRVKSYFVVGATFGTNIKLMKVDKNFSEVFDKEYKKELKGLTFHSFQALENDLFMFATDYEKKDRLFKVYGAKVNKNSGDLIGDFTELGSYEQEDKRDDFEMKMTPVQNGKMFLLVSNISGKNRVSLGIQLFDKTLRKKESAIINISINPNQFSLQDVKYSNNNKIVLLGKEFEETQTGNKKKKKLVFKQYIMSIYNNKGVKETDVRLESENRYVISGKLIEQTSGEMLLAGFYSNAAKKEELNGFYINKVDPQKGVLLLSSYKEINAGMLGKSFIDESDDDDLSKQEKKEAKRTNDDDEDEFPNSFVIKKVDINPLDNSVIITSEVSRYSYYTYTTSSYNSTTKRWTNTTYIVHRFTNQDILIVSADKDGQIKWLNALPKSQLEQVRSSRNMQGGGISFGYDYSGFFAQGGGMPYYSSYTSMIYNNALIILFNDHTSNNVNPEYGDKVKTIYNFRKRSNIYGISIDLTTGKMTRRVISTNSNESILMPRHAYVVNNEFYIPSWRQHAMAKTELKFAKITVK